MHRGQALLLLPHPRGRCLGPLKLVAMLLALRRSCSLGVRRITRLTHCSAAHHPSNTAQHPSPLPSPPLPASPDGLLPALRLRQPARPVGWPVARGGRACQGGGGAGLRITSVHGFRRSCTLAAQAHLHLLPLCLLFVHSIFHLPFSFFKAPLRFLRAHSCRSG